MPEKALIKAVILVALVFLFVNTLAHSSAFIQERKRPNIILVIVDDLDVYSLKYMRNLLTIAAEHGVIFSNFFVTSPVCCPSRVSILTGRYPHNHGIFSNAPPNGGFTLVREYGIEDTMVNVLLQKAGYKTAFFGKYLNGYREEDYIPPGWDEWRVMVTYKRYYNYTLNENGRPITYGFEIDDYLTYVISSKALNFIRRNIKSEKPLFVVISQYAPHLPATPPPNITDVTAPRNITFYTPPSFNEQDVSDKPYWIRNLEKLSREEIEKLHTININRILTLVAVDDMMAKLFNILKEKHVFSNTYIFFTSDNGFHMGLHRLRVYKFTPYEEAIHVPLIVIGPKISGGSSVSQMVLNIDLAPTFAELAGVYKRELFDGRSIVPLLFGLFKQRWRRGFLIESNAVVPGFKAVRTESFLYVEYEYGGKEFYDLNLDPYQLSNILRGDTGYTPPQLHKLLEALSKCKSLECQVIEDTLLQ